MSQAFRRFLHAFPEAPELSGSNVIQRLPSVDTRVPQVPKFTVKGVGSLLQVQLPPSVELIAKRNVLRGILGSGSLSTSVVSRFHIARSSLLRVWGRQPVIQQKIVGTTPLTCLIGSKSNEFLTALELDGTRDWIFTSPIYAYTGKQLQFDPRSGWRPGSAPFAHTLVSGRGSLCFASPSSTVQIKVPEGESVMVSRNHLNGFTADTNATHKQPTLTHINTEFQSPTADVVDLNLSASVSSSPTPSNPSKGSDILAKAQSELLKLIKKVNALIKWASRSGNWGSYVEIYGPSTVIVSAAGKPSPSQVSYTKPQ